MASLDFDFNGLDKEFAALDQTGEIAKEILSAAVKPLERALKRHCDKHKRTGKMSESIEATKVERYSNGAYFSFVRPTGKNTQYVDEHGKVRKRKKPVRNMALLAYIEYGTSKQPKEPIIENAIRDSESQCTTIMQQKFDEYINRKGGG